MSLDPVRLAYAVLALLLYAGLCLAVYRRHARTRRFGEDTAGSDDNAWIVAYASQTGVTEELAGQTAASLRTAGLPVRLCELGQLAAEDLMQAQRILFLASTYGEGDAPDNAARFAGTLMQQSLPLGQLHYAVLALGDRSYSNYCGFGRALDGWLQQQGAQPLFARIEVDGMNAAAIENWQHHLSHLAGTTDAPDWSAPPYVQWRLAERRLLNPGSAGAPAYHLELEPVDAPLPSWESGDLAQIQVPADPDRPRDYSIASVPADGRVHLLLRLHRHPDGSTGLASGWLAEQLPVGATVQMRLRRHPRFQLGDNATRPLILIGNGTGLAGLRGHLKARLVARQYRNWLIFGERNAAHDAFYHDELEHWLASGCLTRLDLVYSRDGHAERYVQDRIHHAADHVREWAEQGAAIYVCGSLQGMAEGVDTALRDVLGASMLDMLRESGRYRRDVY